MKCQGVLIPTQPFLGDKVIRGYGLRNFVFKFLVKVFISLYISWSC